MCNRPEPQDGFDAADAELYADCHYPCKICGNLCAEEFCSQSCYQEYESEMDAMWDEGDEMGWMDEPRDMTDVEADADTLASAGWGTDEDYGYYGDEC